MLNISSTKKSCTFKYLMYSKSNSTGTRELIKTHFEIEPNKSQKGALGSPLCDDSFDFSNTICTKAGLVHVVHVGQEVQSLGGGLNG